MGTCTIGGISNVQTISRPTDGPNKRKRKRFGSENSRLDRELVPLRHEVSDTSIRRALGTCGSYGKRPTLESGACQNLRNVCPIVRSGQASVLSRPIALGDVRLRSGRRAWPFFGPCWLFSCCIVLFAKLYFGSPNSLRRAIGHFLAYLGPYARSGTFGNAWGR